MNKTIFTSLVASFLLFSACDSNSTIDTPLKDKQTELNQNKTLWKKEKPSNYFFTVRPTCFCPDTKKRLVTIKNNKIENVKYIPSNINLDAKALKQEKAISGYFDFIQDAINKDADNIKVTYNKTYGYPETISIDYNKKVVDEEISYEITHFNKTTSYGTVACIESYFPVCGKVELECITAPCQTVEETFSNSCYLNANPLATYLRDGVC